MRKLLRLFFLLIPVFAVAQHDNIYEEWNEEQIGSIKAEWNRASNDTLKMRIARSLGFYYQDRNRDSSLYFNEQQLSLAKLLTLRLWQADALDEMGFILSRMNNYPRSLQCFLDALKILEKESEKKIWNISVFTADGNPEAARLTVLSSTYNDLSRLYLATGNKEKEFSNLLLSLRLAESIKNYTLLTITNGNLGISYLRIGKLDSALIFSQKALDYIDSTDYQNNKGSYIATIGNVYLKRGNYALAKKYFAEAILASKEHSNKTSLPFSYLLFSDLFRSLGEIDSSIFYSKKALNEYKTMKDQHGMNNAYNSLFSLYKSNGTEDSAFLYIQLYKALSDSLNNAEKIKINQYENIGFDEQFKMQQQESERVRLENKIRTYSLIIGIAVFMLIAFLLYLNNRNRKKANELLQRQKEKVESTLTELKSTQAQLIQSEKMASLGELTAGIAHEIQNPLNFVNNFSEVNTELVDELKTELTIGNNQQAMEIADNIKDNEQKINHHGKRADAIVKGMLQHSRSSSGVKEPTDIDALCDEYLRLAYHGLRAKDNTFNATMKTDYDGTIGKINIIPQDIGRALLNLYNNAFYAAPLPPEGGFKESDYKHEPTVWLSTKKVGDKVLISVRDNGPGIPQKILDKIFQPFFTTKPTGQGTGLGLSLAYDIVKAHGGEIKVESKEGKGAEFTIQLPVI